MSLQSAQRPVYMPVSNQNVGAITSATLTISVQGQTVTYTNSACGFGTYTDPSPFPPDYIKLTATRVAGTEGDAYADVSNFHFD